MYFISIDPGSNLGLSVNEINPDTGEFKVIYTKTTDTELYAHHYFRETLIPNFGMRYAKSEAVYQIVRHLIESWGVHLVVCESPYMGKFPQAFMSLVECIQSIRRAAADHSVELKFRMIDPSTIKKANGVKGNKGDKNLMRVAGKRYLSEEILDKLDEHAIDASAIGYAWYKIFWLNNE